MTSCSATLPLACSCPRAIDTRTSTDETTGDIHIVLSPDLSAPGERWQLEARHGSRRVSMAVARHALLNPPAETPSAPSSCAPAHQLFRLPLKQWVQLPQVRRIDCPPESPCDAELAAALTAGWRLFHFPKGLSLVGEPGGITLGHPTTPLLFAIEGPQHWPANSTLHGMLWTQNDEKLETPSSGLLTVHGTARICGTTPVTVLPSEPTWIALRQEAHWISAVPGTWSDRP